MKTKIVIGVAAALALSACTTFDPYTGEQKISNTAGGAAVGALGGAVGGAIIGAATGTDPRVGALIGAGVGGLSGAAVGSYMDQQEAEMRAQLASTGVSVTRNGAQIILNMPSNITFAVDSASINPAFQQTLVSVALVLQKYNRTVVDIAGYTDSDGSDAYNQTLSMQRAQSVAGFLGQQGVDTRRFNVLGYGETQPIASNATEAGKAQNRRVEIYISPYVAG
jgi:outer membrane protein OmpA-like peptidoglycan-associated protein